VPNFTEVYQYLLVAQWGQSFICCKFIADGSNSFTFDYNEKKLGRELISLACRHHIMELIIAKVFETLMGLSCGPNIKLFQRFGEY
jgi:hypothetical protein